MSRMVTSTSPLYGTSTVLPSDDLQVQSNDKRETRPCLLQATNVPQRPRSRADYMKLALSCRKTCTAIWETTVLSPCILAAYFIIGKMVLHSKVTSYPSNQFNFLFQCILPTATLRFSLSNNFHQVWLPCIPAQALLHFPMCWPWQYSSRFSTRNGISSYPSR